MIGRNLPLVVLLALVGLLFWPAGEKAGAEEEARRPCAAPARSGAVAARAQRHGSPRRGLTRATADFNLQPILAADL